MVLDEFYLGIKFNACSFFFFHPSSPKMLLQILVCYTLFDVLLETRELF